MFYSLNKGSLKFPKSSSQAALLVGPGTGIAPFISLLEELECVSKTTGQPMSRFKFFVFFGCRHKNTDFLFSDYLLKLQKEEK